MRLRALALLISALTVDAPPRDASLALADEFEVIATDSLGQPFPMTKVAWYLPPVGGVATAVAGVCANADCSHWRWTDPPTGTFYVEANWTAPSALDPTCLWSAYEATSVSRAPGETRVVRLQFHALYLCE